ncbi:DoxX family protein [Gracilimonas mengyeensis]|uniref:Putative oxidoreductase n=1 Tax=Gracilimonas mengyeensis TaxID=1302730 RepID=A0A521DS35_9BACT|nr:DoxX family protein [Gracilimonas mengyeensis]SMO74395.1 putative oxidoreductase [Gracilimonas mengyeensis]
MLYKFLESQEEWSPVIIRYTLALVIFPHGAQKLFGWFGGYGFTGTMEFFTATAGLPWSVGFLVILIEFFVPLLLIAGLLVRLNAIAIFGLFVGIIFTSHIQYGFFMNWYGNQQEKVLSFICLY